MVLRTYLGTVLPVQQQNGSICNVERRHGSPYKVITTRAVNDIQFLAVPLHMETVETQNSRIPAPPGSNR